MKNPDLLGMPDEVIASIATSEFHQVTGHEATSIDISRTKIPAWDFSWKGYTDIQLPKGILFALISLVGQGSKGEFKKLSS